MAARNHESRIFKFRHKREEFQIPFDALREEPILISYFFNPHLPDLPYGKFPQNISMWIWSSAVKGVFRLFCKLTNGHYAYFEARRGYTGFDYHDTMRISVTRTIAEVIDYCMTEKVYQTYIADTRPDLTINECSDEEESEKDEKSVVFSPTPTSPTPTRADYDTVDGIPSPKPTGNPYQKIISMLAASPRPSPPAST